MKEVEPLMETILNVVFTINDMNIIIIVDDIVIVIIIITVVASVAAVVLSWSLSSASLF